MSGVRQDLRQAIRATRRSPALTTVAVLSLALGIAPNVAVFSIIDAIGLRPLPIREPGGLVAIYTSDRSEPYGSTSYQDYVEIRDESRLLAGVAAETTHGIGISGAGRPPEAVMASDVSGNYFATLGLTAAHGRLIDERDDRDAGTAVAVLSDNLWRRRFDADPGIVGKTVRLNSTDCIIVGVAPKGFAGTRPVLAPDVWTPLAFAPTLLPGRARAARPRTEREFRLFARLKPGATIAQARAEIDALGRHLATSYPESNKGRATTAEFEQDVRRRLPARLGLVALSAVSLILLTACANVAGLLLGRGEARRSEIAIRLALGAGRARILRQLLVEGAVLAVVAAAASTLLTYWVIRLVPVLVPAMPITMNLDFRIDWRVLAFTLLVATFSVPLFALAPALVASRPDLTPVLKGESARLGRWRWLTLRNALVVGQISVCLVLLVSSGLLVRSLAASRAIDPGFLPRPMLFSTMAPPAMGYDERRTRDFYERLLTRLRETPGVEAATLVRHLPLNSLFGGGGAQRVEVPGFDLPPGEEAVRVKYNVVGLGYFETMGTPILRGRDFGPGDGPASQGAVLINETMARTYWAGRDPVGARLTLVSESDQRRECAVVGIVRDAKYMTLTEAPVPYLYLPYAQRFHGETTVVVRVRGDARGMVSAFRRAIDAVDPAMPTLQITTLSEHLRMATFLERTLAAVATLLGGLGLLLSVIGLHGVVTYLVERRTREIGIRMALGASAGDIRQHVLGQGGRLVATGIAIGLVLAAAAARLIATSVYGVRAADPVAFGAGTAVVAVVALAASWLPARRAQRMDPVVALRQQ